MTTVLVLSSFLGSLWMSGVFLSMLVFPKSFCFKKMYSHCAASVCMAAQAHLTYLLKVALLRFVTYYTITNLFSARVLNTQLSFLTPATVAKCFSSSGKLRRLLRCPKLDLRLKMKHTRFVSSPCSLVSCTKEWGETMSPRHLCLFKTAFHPSVLYHHLHPHRVRCAPSNSLLSYLSCNQWKDDSAMVWPFCAYISESSIGPFKNTAVGSDGKDSLGWIKFSVGNCFTFERAWSRVGLCSTTWFLSTTVSESQACPRRSFLKVLRKPSVLK